VCYGCQTIWDIKGKKAELKFVILSFQKWQTGRKRGIFKVKSALKSCIYWSACWQFILFSICTEELVNTCRNKLDGGLCTMLYPFLALSLSLTIGGLTLEQHSGMVPKLFKSLEITPCIYFLYCCFLALDGRYKGGHEQKKPKGRPVGR
jgi:hypothetical protein